MEHGYGQIGALPFDLMNLIFFDTSIQAAVSIYLSCKYWRDKYDRIINHDTINLLINSRYIEDRKETLYSIKNGCVSSYTGPNYYNTSTIIERGFFSSVRHLAEFLQSFNKIMTEPVEDIERSSVEYCFLRTTAPSSISKYFSYNSSDQIFPLGMQRMSLQTADQLKDLMNWCKYCNQPQEMAFNDEEAEQLANLKLIEIRSRHRKTLKDNYNWNINAKIDGDGNFSISVKNIHLHIRSSPMIYKELTEVLKYSTHKKDISENMAKKSKVIVEAFELTLKENNEQHYIQEYKLYHEHNTVRTVIENNGYKTNALKKVLQILERIMQHKSLEINLFLRESYDLPPANSIAHSLARFVHYANPLYGLPLISEIIVDLSQSQMARSLEKTKKFISA